MVADDGVDYKTLPLFPDISGNAILEFEFRANEIEEGVEPVEAELAFAELDREESVEPPEREGDHGSGSGRVDIRVGLVEVVSGVEVVEGVELGGGVGKTA